MATILNHVGVRIVTLQPGDVLAEVCRPGDIVLEQAADGWWIRFVGDDGEVDSYDEAEAEYKKAVWTAKAAAEFQAE